MNPYPLSSYNQFKKDFKNALIYLVLGIIFWSMLANYLRIGYDSTDGDKRSGMALYTDELTGCQYLGTAMGGITPRLNAQTEHICDEQHEIEIQGHKI